MEDLRLQLAPHLLPGEALVWAGRPDPGKHLGANDVFLIPFSVLWCAFSIFWIVTASTTGAPIAFVLFGVPFVALGVYFVIGRFIYKASRKRRTAYGLTTTRALVTDAAGSLSQAPLLGTRLDQQRSRDGQHVSVTFGQSARGWTAGPSYANTGMDLFDRGAGPLGFYDVADVPGLETALRSTRR